MKKIYMLLFMCIPAQLIAQKKLDGDYSYRKMELASGFRFSPEGKFQFFYSYGAVDRNASGTYVVKGDALILKSEKAGGNDFTVTSESKNPKGYLLEFNDRNTYLLKNIVCTFYAEGKEQVMVTDEEGKVNADMATCDSIFVMHGLFPDIPTRIKDVKNTNSHFTMNLNPSLGEFSFKRVELKIIDNKTISCSPNDLLGESAARFIKE